MPNPFPSARPARTLQALPSPRCRNHASALVTVAALVVAAWAPPALAASLLNSAQEFAVLAASTVTSDPASTIYGELGVSPGTSVTGFPPGVVVGGLIHSADSVASVAQGDAQAAYNKLGAIAPALRTDLTGKTLGSLGSPGYDSLAPGIYAFDTTTSINGILTLDFLTNPTGSFTFLIGTGLLASADSTVNVVNGGASSSIYWRVGSSATLNSGSDFAGNILAGISISMLDGAQIQGGRAIALNGAVTMIGGGVSSDCSLGGCGTTTADFGSNGFSGLASPVPEPASALLFAAGAVALRLGRFKSQKDDAICA